MANAIQTATPPTLPETKPWANSTEERLIRLSKINYQGRYADLPLTITTLEKQCLRHLGTSLKAKHVPVTFPQCVKLITKLLAHFWESKIPMRLAVEMERDWYNVLQKHSATTIEAVVLNWLSTAKRKPTPADILELCDEADETPRQLDRLRRLAGLPVRDPEEATPVVQEKMLGCPIVLSRIMRFAAGKGIPFLENEQLEYLASGNAPGWFMPPEEKPVAPEEALTMPTREELLAGMTPEERLRAIKPTENLRG